MVDYNVLVLISHGHHISNNIWTNIALSKFQKPVKKLQKPSEHLNQEKAFTQNVTKFCGILLSLDTSLLGAVWFNQEDTT